MQPPGDQRFYRGNDRFVGGVCSGLAEGLHVDPLWVRLAFVALSFVQGIGVVLYVVLWVIMPERAQDRPAGRNAFDSISADVKRAWADLQRQFGGRPAAGPSVSTTPASGAPPEALDPNAPVPDETAQVIPPAPPPAQARPATHNQSLVAGVILVLIGLAFLASNTGLVNWSEVWPIALIVFGILLLARALERRT